MLYINPMRRITPEPRKLFDTFEFRESKLNALPKLAPLKKTELNIDFFGEGADPFHLFLSPPDKTISQYLKDLPAHLEAVRMVFAANMIAKDPEKMDIREEQAAQWRSAINRSHHKVQPSIVVNDLGGLTDMRKVMIKREFKFDFDDLVNRLKKFNTSLHKTKDEMQPEDMQTIRGGVALLREINGLYRKTVPRFYEYISEDTEKSQQFEPFAKALGAVAWKLEQELTASRLRKGSTQPAGVGGR